MGKLEVKARKNGKASKRRSRIGRQEPRKPGGQDLLGRFGIYLSRRRKETNLSLRQFARSAGMAHTNLFQMEELRKNPRLTELARLAKAFREPLTEFLRPLQQAQRSFDAACDPPSAAGPVESGSTAGENSPTT